MHACTVGSVTWRFVTRDIVIRGPRPKLTICKKKLFKLIKSCLWYIEISPLYYHVTIIGSPHWARLHRFGQNLCIHLVTTEHLMEPQEKRMAQHSSGNSNENSFFVSNRSCQCHTGTVDRPDDSKSASIDSLGPVVGSTCTFSGYPITS